MIKHCEKCNVDVLNLANHLKSKKHLENDPDQPLNQVNVEDLDYLIIL
jgi:hypothetical protein